uniref:F-box associated domain-containing protein n=1 Tax=Solanum tuberosum TaxID=4113 RepID=M1DAS7_SOLTU
MKKTLPILEQSLENEKINYSIWSYNEDEGSHEDIIEGISTDEGCVYWSLDYNPNITQDWSSSERKLGLFRFVSKNSIIIRFNAKSDELERFSTPDFIGEMELYVLSPLNGCLGLYGGKTESNVWIKKQDKWELLVKMHRIKPCVKSIKVLYYTKDDEIIFQGAAGGQHFFSNYSPRKRAIFVTYYRPLPYIRSWYVHRDATCLDSLSFPRLDTHGQD